MSKYEKLDFDSELLAPMRMEIEKCINKLSTICLATGKEAELALKINLYTIKQSKTLDNGNTIEWKEPRLEFKIDEKVKECKSSTKGNLGFDYAIMQNEDEVYVEKINEQTSLY